MPSLNYLSASISGIHSEWKKVLLAPEIYPELLKIDQALCDCLQQGKTIYPPCDQIFTALKFCPPCATKVVILGQDPYHGAGEAMGLAFSVPANVRVPPSLRNIFKEQAQDLGLNPPQSGNLIHWAKQGVLLLNSVMTVEADAAASHAKMGWQAISDALIDKVNQINQGCVFMLWGNWARSKAERITSPQHLVLTAAHPSPLSASRGFLGCKHFSQANQWLIKHGGKAIDWAEKPEQNQLF